MCPIRALRPCVLAVFVACLALTSGPARSQTDPNVAARDHAIKLAAKGDEAGALAEVEQILTKSPDDPNALYDSAHFNFDLHNYDAARGRVERLVKVTGSYAVAWELLTQITQAQGDLKRRDEAIERLKQSISSALDPDVRNKDFFIREIIPVPGGPGSDRKVSVADFFDRTGSDYTRYQFTTADPLLSPDTGLLLRTDEATTEAWTETALLPPKKQLFHLDLVEPDGNGGTNVSIFQYYVGEPDFDTVNAKVMQILRGEAQPLSGQPKSMVGILKP